VLVNCVCPGPTETPLLGVFEGEHGQRLLEGMRRAIPLRRVATPEDTVGLVAYLAISVEGGLVM
jgi:2-hydroxycyclohexanecarboxyl-CoA dehydrogenase